MATPAIAAQATPLGSFVNSIIFRQILLTALFLSFFAWYIYPLAFVDYYLVTTDWFSDHNEQIALFATSLGDDRLGLDEIPKLLVGIVGSGGISLMLIERKQAPVWSTMSALLIAVVVLIAAYASVATYHLLITHGASLDKTYGMPIQKAFLDLTVSRFRELWVLISAVAGFSVVAARAQK